MGGGEGAWNHLWTSSGQEGASHPDVLELKSQLAQALEEGGLRMQALKEFLRPRESASVVSQEEWGQLWNQARWQRGEGPAAE